MNPLASALLWILLNALGTAATLLPRSLELVIGPWLGRIALAVDPKRRGIAEENIKRCFPAMSDSERAELLRANYEHYGILALELLHLFSPIPGHWRSYVNRVAVVVGFDNWQRAHDKGKGVIFLSLHMANWELMAARGAQNGIKVTIATRHLKPPWLLRKMESSRLSAGVKAAYLPDTVPTLLRGLKKGESIGFVLDQYAPPPMGVPARFFGVEVDTLGAVGTFSDRYRAPIIPVWQVRRPDGIVEIRFEPELELGAAAKDPKASTQILVSRVESWIRQNPSQWLWVHRRFKNLKEPALPA